MTKWISVKKKWPKTEEYVLVSNGKLVGIGWLTTQGDWLGEISDIIYGYEKNLLFDNALDEVTCWMPLPEPPNSN